jgi:hypothetical protein
MTGEEAKAGIECGEPWTVARAAYILTGWPYSRRLDPTEIELGVDAETVTASIRVRKSPTFLSTKCYGREKRWPSGAHARSSGIALRSIANAGARPRRLS